MTARVARGNAARGGRRGGGRSVNTRRAKNPTMLESVGFAPGTGRRISNWIFAGMIAAVILTLILAFRLPQIAGSAIGEGVGRVGFTMRRVEIQGAERVSRLAIYNAAFDQPSMAMPLVDLAATRERLMAFGWIREARVSRRWPDTLVVDVVERRPAAIWQHNRELNLIDAEGVVLEPVRLDAMPELPLVVGPAANRHIGGLATLLDAAPRLRPLVSGASWVGNRRWDVRFSSGETLSLPEGDELALAAIRSFAMMDQQGSLLGRGYARIDMRDPRRTYIRVSDRPGATVPTLASPDPGAPPENLAETI
ncbi:MAG: cell division protein FtsQ/DivIB [Sphingosinicella sp.]|uniref:cell division protein FtsQ/DivIB n=1 Tax=Sphingosinicella sp. TaxID=1917971 RepID=UPI004037DBCA